MYPSFFDVSIFGETGFALLPVLLTKGLPTGMFGVASYVLTAMTLHTLAKRRCIRHPWLAWVPVANLWLLGSLSDQYRYVVKGQIKSKRKVLLLLKAVSVGLTVSMVAMAVAVAFKVVSGVNYGMWPGEILRNQAGPLLVMAGIGLPLMGVSIASAVIYYMALFDIYTSCDPENNVLFTVLSILFARFTKPFFLFFSRNKDLGMPPRREDPVCEPQPEAAPQQTWDAETDI